MTIVCDLDGVVYVDGGAVPGAGAALSELQAQGKRLLFVTNNATKTALDVVETVHALTGFAVEEGDVVTSEYDLTAAFRKFFDTDDVPVISGLAIQADTTDSDGGGKARASIASVAFIKND